MKSPDENCLTLESLKAAFDRMGREHYAPGYHMVSPTPGVFVWKGTELCFLCGGPAIGSCRRLCNCEDGKHGED